METAVAIKGAIMLLAALGGWLLARTTPHWAEDRHREYSPHTAMEQYFRMPTDYTGQYRGCFGGVAQRPAAGCTMWRVGLWLPLAMIMAALVLAFFFWYEGPKEHRVDRLNFIADPSHWIVLGTALAGYLVSIVLANLGRK